MPQLVDPNFRQAVVLLCEHTSGGAFGLVLNRPTTARAVESVRLDPPVPPLSQLPLWVGGPVEPQRGWILLGEKPAESDALKICRGLYLSTSPLVLRRILTTESQADRIRLLNGYAGWGPGQLDAELSASAWLTSDIDVDLIFDSDPGEMWERAIRRLGVDPAMLQISHGVH
jgi:putative transcriptional regulator